MQAMNYALKLKTKDAANKIKNGPPKFQEVLRQRCRDQIRKKRHEIFNSRRPGLADANNESIHETLTEIVRKEFSDLSTMVVDGDENDENPLSENSWPMSQEELIGMEEEILKEEERWILEEYESLQQLENEMMDKYIEDILKDDVICPMCEKAAIMENRDGLICPGCCMSLPRLTIEEFSSGIKKHLTIHNENCMERPGFTTLSENNLSSLYLTCDTCSSFALITSK